MSIIQYPKIFLFLVILFFSNFQNVSAQDEYEILYDTFNASGWFGGDDRVDFGPRHVGNAQSVLIDSNILLESFAFYFTHEFDFSENPDGFGHEVDLVLNIRNDDGSLIQSEMITLPASFSGGWAVWEDINLSVDANTTLIFSSYLVGAYDMNQYFTGLRGDADAGYSDGVRYTKQGISDADMENWTDWFEHPWDSNFWLRGTTVLGVEDNVNASFENSVVVSPNPFLNSLEIKLNLESEFDVLTSIYNLSGKLIFSKNNQNLGIGSQVISMQDDRLERLAEGIYILRIEANGSVKNVKLIKK